ncbi:MAG TPA: plastocyanin/azurin family copper-binding protein [Gemmatimonadales bacterium]|jgi:plastocyanin|nr:plastocyanin/azurin family copper-binding protein [Gemmatimonadales bacterium]
MRAMLIAWSVGAGAMGAVPDTQVQVRTFQFREARLDVPVGTRIVWSNQDEIEHTVTSGAPDSADGAFAGQLAGKGSSFVHGFDQPGTYPYYCERHHFMRGEIRVLPDTTGAH